jgi:hypothetical protein
MGFSNSFTNEYDMNLTNETVITPTTGKGIAVKGVYVTTEGTSGYVRVLIGSDTVCTLHAKATQGTSYVPMYVAGAVDIPVKITSTLGEGNNFFVLINYSEK